MTMHTMPDILDDGDAPYGTTLVLYGDNREQWNQVLPLLEPVCIWQTKEGKTMVRWRMTREVADALGLDLNTRCTNPGCDCGDGILHCEEHDAWLIDTNFGQTGWCFVTEKEWADFHSRAAGDDARSPQPPAAG